MTLKITISHDEPEAQSALTIGLFQTHGAVGFSGVRASQTHVLPGSSASFELESGDYLKIEDGGEIQELQSTQSSPTEQVSPAEQEQPAGQDDVSGQAGAV